MFSEKDGSLTMTIPGVIDDYPLSTQKDATFDTGDTTNQVVAAMGVVYCAEGASKPNLSAMLVSVLEGAKVRKLCINPRTGKKRSNIQISLSFRRDGQSLSFRFLGCMLGEGGGLKASDGEGATSDKAHKWLAKRVMCSIDGGAFTRYA